MRRTSRRFRPNREAVRVDVHSAAFREWFGDSRVVHRDADRRGEPLIVWHGHPEHIEDFFVFDLSRVIDLGFHFGTKSVAEEFGPAKPYYLSIQNPLYLKDPGDWIDREGTLKQITYDVRGPLYQPWAFVTVEQYEDARQAIADLKAEWAANRKDSYDTTSNPAFRRYRTEASKIVRSLIERGGFDGVVYTNMVEGLTQTTSWIAFRPTQIKSADQNDGTFDPRNPDVRRNGSRRRSSRRR